MADVLYRFRPRGGTKAEWTENNPTLADRELAFAWDDQEGTKTNVELKLGDGTTAYNSLPAAMTDNITDKPVDKIDEEGVSAETEISANNPVSKLFGIVKKKFGSLETKVGAATSKHWDITVQAESWVTVANTKPTFGGMTAQYQNTVSGCTGMTADTDIGGIVFISGDRASAAAWAWLAPSADSVTLYAVTKPTGEFVLRLWEVK